MRHVFSDERKRAFLNPEGADKPLRSPLPPDVLDRARRYRKQRLVDQVVAHDCAAILLYDPISIRYALDVSNMQIWAMHNQFHYALIAADGYAVDFQFHGCEHLVRSLPTVQEVRSGRSCFFLSAGDRLEERVERWADEIAALVRERSGNNRRIAVDKLDPPGVDALRAQGLTIVEGQELTETARAIKSEDEIKLMSWTVRVCEAGMARMWEASLPGRTEQEIWAELHYENIRSGGEWLETRLLSCGPRTNPWFQECSDYVCNEGELLSFDTDLIGPYGYCADLSRSWPIGRGRLSNEQRSLYAAALDQVSHNASLIKPGVTFEEFNERSWRMPQKYVANRYSVAFHGVGMADEWPSIPTHPDFQRAATGAFAENMVVCVESLIGEEGKGECVKLETQVVVEANGVRRLDRFPWEEV
jgi:Xaa-Pro aminopeptidase